MGLGRREDDKTGEQIEMVNRGGLGWRESGKTDKQVGRVTGEGQDRYEIYWI